MCVNMCVLEGVLVGVLRCVSECVNGCIRGALCDTHTLQDAVGIDLERDFDLGDTTGGRGDTSELEFAQLMVVLGSLQFILKIKLN